jgi:hypothetical protein
LVSDRVYFSARAQEERAAARLAGSLQASKAHLELAFRYEDLASALYAAERRVEAPFRDAGDPLPGESQPDPTRNRACRS